jgi:hypothetical protein
MKNARTNILSVSTGIVAVGVFAVVQMQGTGMRGDLLASPELVPFTQPVLLQEEVPPETDPAVYPAEPVPTDVSSGITTQSSLCPDRVAPVKVIQATGKEQTAATKADAEKFAKDDATNTAIAKCNLEPFLDCQPAASCIVDTARGGGDHVYADTIGWPRIATVPNSNTYQKDPKTGKIVRYLIPGVPWYSIADTTGKCTATTYCKEN